MTKLLISAFVLLGSPLTVASQERLLFGLAPNQPDNVACGCSFKESIPNNEESLYGSGDELLVMDVNGTPPSAIVNLGQANLNIEPQFNVRFPLFQCKPDEIWETEWKGPEIVVLAKLKTVRAGYEACWLTGELEVVAGTLTWAAPVKGVCGC